MHAGFRYQFTLFDEQFPKCAIFQVQMNTPQGNHGDVHLLAPVHADLPAGQTSLWGSGVDVVTPAAGRDLSGVPTVPAPVQAPASIPATAQVETQAPAQTPALVLAQNQPPLPVSAKAAAMPQTPALIRVNAPASVPMQVPTAVQTIASAPVQALVSASGPPKGSSTSSETPYALGKPKLSILSLGSDPIPVTLPDSAPVAASVTSQFLQPSSTQTTVSVSECAGQATTRQPFDSTSSSSILQQESCVEVGMMPKFVHFHV